MTQYKIRQDGITEIKKQLAIEAIAKIFILTLLLFTLSRCSPKILLVLRDDLLVIATSLIFIILIELIFKFVKKKKFFENYSITLTEDQIIAEQTNSVQKIIKTQDIIKIFLRVDGSFALKTNKRIKEFIVPKQIDNYFNLKNSLSKIHPVIYKDYFIIKHRLTFLFILLSSWLCSLFLNQEIFSILFWVVNYLFWFLYIITFLKSDNTPEWKKRNILMLLSGLVLFAIIT